jgi:DNA polymerase mu
MRRSRPRQQIDEFLETGRIEESEEILKSSRYQALRTFSSVYTIGHHTAKDLYDRHHCRTLEDVRQHYASIAEESEEVRLKVKERRRKEGGMLHVDIVEEWIKIKDDLDAKCVIAPPAIHLTTRIPREEVQEIAACVMEHLGALLDGCQHTICGG